MSRRRRSVPQPTRERRDPSRGEPERRPARAGSSAGVRRYEKVVPKWVRAVRAVGVYGGALVLAVAAFGTSMVATASLALDREFPAAVEEAAQTLQTEQVVVQDGAQGLLTAADLERIAERARASQRPTRVVIGSGDGWPTDLAEQIAVASDLESRFVVVDAEGAGGGASTLEEDFVLFADFDPETQSLVDGVLAAIEKADRIPLLGEPEDYAESTPTVVATWGAAALGAALVALVGGLAVGVVAIAASLVILLLIAAYGAAIGWRRRVVGIPLTQDPSRRRTGPQPAYRPPATVLLRLDRVRAAERGAQLRAEVLALGERIDASAAPTAGALWKRVLDCYETAGRIADTTEGRDDVASRADVVAGLVLVARGRQALDAAEHGASYEEETDCYANPFHGRAVGRVNTVRLGSRRPSGPVPEQVDVCATCLSSADNGIAVADPLTLDAGLGRFEAYWMLGVRPWTSVGLGAPSQQLVDAWDRARG